MTRAKERAAASRPVRNILVCVAAALVAPSLIALTPQVAEAQTEARPLRERAAFGAYTPGLPYYPAGLRKVEARGQLGTQLEIVSGFIDFDYVLGERRDRLLSGGGQRKLLYSWEPHCGGDEVEARGSECIAFRDISAGRLDAYLTRVAESMKRFRHEIYVRPWAEMNADWSPYHPGSGGARAGSVAEFKAAWRYLYTFFKTRGVDNLRFVFNPDAAVDSDHAALAEIWPGAEFVDVLGIDGYNWGESGRPGGNTWLEFEAVFGPMYQTLTALHPTAPVWICEFGSKEPEKNDGSANSPAPPDPAHSKARWIENFMSSTAFPRIEALVYYDAYTPERDNQRDFRFASSAASLAMIRRQLKRRARTR
jgi:Glycosyl hydrolase family 26